MSGPVPPITRDMLARAFPENPRLVRAFEDQAAQVQEVADTVSGALEATDSIANATVVTLSPNASFANERVLTQGDGIVFAVSDGKVTLGLARHVPRTTGGFRMEAVLRGDTAVAYPLTGELATLANPETLKRKTLDAPAFTGLGNHADDAAAAAAGVPIGNAYLTAGALKVRTA